jgi:hypothetical protein
MFKEALKMKIEELTKEREAVFDQMEPLKEKVSFLYNEIKALQNKLSCIEREEIESPEMTDDQRIAFYLENDGDTKGMEHFKAKEKFWQDQGLWPSGYYPSIQQQGLKVMLYTDKRTNQQTIDIINKVLPHMKTIEGIDDTRPNIKVFGIFEYTLSEYGSYSLFFDTDREEWIVSIISWHRRRDVYVTKSLEDVINYISINHSYDGNDYDEDY